MSEILHDTHRETYLLLASLADKRVQESEDGLMQIGSYDETIGSYHDMDKDLFAVTQHVHPDALKHMAELVLNSYDTRRYTPGETKAFDAIRDSLRPQLSPVRDRLESGSRVMVLTAHQTRLEPALVAFMSQAAIAENAAEHNDLRGRSTILISRYLTCFNINVGKLAGGEDQYSNILGIARELGSIGLSFPNTPNMRNLSGVDIEFQRRYNKGLLAKIAAIPLGDMCFMAANGTMEAQDDDGYYEISEVKTGTCNLIKDGWDVLPVASIHDGDNPFSVAGELIPASKVTDSTIHESMAWIANERTVRGVPSRYTSATAV